MAAAVEKPRASSPAMSRENRMQREQRMHLSSSRTMRGPKSTIFGLVNFFFDEPAGRLSVIHRILLQLAFARLVANRAIQRVIDQKGFQHGLAHLLGRGRTGVNFHTGRNRRGAGNGAARSTWLIGQRGAGDFRSASGLSPACGPVRSQACRTPPGTYGSCRRWATLG